MPWEVTLKRSWFVLFHLLRIITMKLFRPWDMPKEQRRLRTNQLLMRVNLISWSDNLRLKMKDSKSFWNKEPVVYLSNLLRIPNNHHNNQFKTHNSLLRKNQLRSQLRSQLISQLISQLKNLLKSQPRSQLTNQLKSLFNNQLKIPNNQLNSLFRILSNQSNNPLKSQPRKNLRLALLKTILSKIKQNQGKRNQKFKMTVMMTMMIFLRKSKNWKRSWL